MNRLQQSRIFLVAAILLIVAFQSYWLNRLYKEEYVRLEKETGTLFREVVYNLQVDRFKADTLIFKPKNGPNLFVYNAINALKRQTENTKKQISQRGKTDTEHASNAGVVIIEKKDSFFSKNPARIKIGHDALPPNMDTALLNRMARSGMNVIVRYGDKKNDSLTVFEKRAPHVIKTVPDPKTIKIFRDTANHTNTVKTDFKIDLPQPERAFIRMITEGKAFEDTISRHKLDSAYKKELDKTGVSVYFIIQKANNDSLHWLQDTLTGKSLKTTAVAVGLIHPAWYRAEFENPFPYLIKKISPQILFSFFLVAFTSLAFIFLYRNLLAQRKLTEIKNEFISNVTHELKTPIATVNVAIEALRNFGGLQSPERTREYLDISASELQRLSLLVDKVLKLSMFENHEITLQKESFDLLHLVEEVMASMKLQFEKQKAAITLSSEGDNFMIDADKLHITSVIYNLLDNALKYSKEDAVIEVKLIRRNEYFELRVKDNGIGIDEAYQNKIFEQFFRVPSGNRHNTKGYGLGLSYVNHIIRRHHGSIEVESEPGKGSTFIVRLPFTEKLKLS